MIQEPFWQVTSSHGISLVEACGVKMALMCPSRQRLGLLAGNPLLPLLNVFVHESEEDAYRRGFDGRVASLHTHAIENHLPRIVNMNLEVGWAAGADAVLKVDDDFRGVQAIHGSAPPIGDRDALLFLAATSARFALEMGAGLFGWEQKALHSTLLPFHLRNWVVGQFRIVLDPTLRTLETISIMEDMSLSLSSVEKTGFCIRDSRYKIVTDGLNPGGLRTYRDEDRVRETVRILSERWPEAITPGDLWGSVHIPQ